MDGVWQAPRDVADAAPRPGTRLLPLSRRQGQVDTPDEIVRFTWKCVRTRRPNVGTVLDLGAGRATFADHGHFQSYVGYEVDASRIPTYATSKRRVVRGDALDARGEYDLVIGNPPYVRNQDIDENWQRRAVAKIEKETGIDADQRANLYVYFMWLALIRTGTAGLTAQIVPADWLVRPSALHIRDYITSQRWHVSAYLFDDGCHFFRSVKTNVTLTIIDKSSTAPWSFYRVSNRLDVSPTKRPDALAQSPRGASRAGTLRAGRGLSPGSQGTFVLTEDERREHGIRKSSVVPCVTSLRGIPRHVRTLSIATFQKHFVEGGRRCWLLKTEHAVLAPQVMEWLQRAPRGVQENHTCRDRMRWFSFKMPPVPDILYSSGFTEAGPHFMVNEIDARAVGSVHGIFNAAGRHDLSRKLRAIDFAQSSLHYAGRLKKVEISQMNSLLDEISKRLP